MTLRVPSTKRVGPGLLRHHQDITDPPDDRWSFNDLTRWVRWNSACQLESVSNLTNPELGETCERDKHVPTFFFSSSCCAFHCSFAITGSIPLSTRANALSVCGNPHDNRTMNGHDAIHRLYPQVLGLLPNSTSASISFVASLFNLLNYCRKLFTHFRPRSSWHEQRAAKKVGLVLTDVDHQTCGCKWPVLQWDFLPPWVSLWP